MHILITKRTPAAPWRCRNACVVHSCRPRLARRGTWGTRDAAQMAHFPLTEHGVFGGYGRAQTTQNHSNANATWPATEESAIEGGCWTSLRSRRGFERKQPANAGADVRFLRLFLRALQLTGLPPAAGPPVVGRGGGGAALAAARAAPPVAVFRAMWRE